MHQRSVVELGRALRAREVSSVELTGHLLSRIEARGPALNAFITVTPETALEQAKDADRRLQAGDAGPLTGVPIAHKDIFCTHNVKTTCGSRMRRSQSRFHLKKP